MSWQFTPHGFLLALAAIASASLAVIAWRRRTERGARAFAVLMLGGIIWAGGNALQVSSTGLEAKLLFRTIAYVGHNIMPISLLVFALVYTGRQHWVTRRNVALLAAEPMAVAFLVTPTDALGYHDLIWTETAVATTGPLVTLARSFGPWYWLNTAYNYALILIAFYLFLFLATQANAATRKQGFALVAGSIPPFFANILWILGATHIDYTPVAFTVMGVVFGVAIFRYRLFDVVPVARETVLDAIQDGYVVLDEHDRVADINQPARRRATAVDDAIGRPVADVLPYCVDLLEEHRTATASSGTGPESDIPDVEDNVAYVDEHDNPHYFEVHISSLRRSQFTGRLVVLRDVTEQHLVERRYQTLIENASDLIAVLDEDGRYTYHSPSVEQILGYTPAELEGESAFDYVHPDDRDQAREEFRRGVEDPEYRPSLEFRFRHADGSWRWLESRGRNLLDDLIVEGFVINSRDITERKEREQKLRQQNERLEEFASVAAHDLRNPLNIISGHIDLARETGDERHFEPIEQALDRIETLIDDVLTLARQGRLVDETHPVDLRTIAERAWGNVETREATLAVDSDVPVIQANESRLCALFENLFRNAVEHGGSSVTVRVGTTSEGFYVEDDGAGIPPEDRSHIFDRGFSTESQGTGLGLPIVQSIATAHGWDVVLADGTDGGARFEISGVERAETVTATEN